MDQEVVLNEELPRKYDSYSSSVAAKRKTLDEPVIDTIVRLLILRREILWKYT